jgi:hypothetical protein
LSRTSLTWRAVSVVLATGAVASLAVVSVSFVAFTLFTPQPRPTGFPLQEFSFLWFIGLIVAISVAAIMGLIVEWPKALWLSRQQSGGLAVQLWLSILAPTLVMAGWLYATAGYDPHRQRTDEADWIFPLFVFLFGGLCSGLFWWKLVILPWRRRRRSG